MSEFKYLVHVLDKSGIDKSECSRKVVNDIRVAVAIMSLPNARGLQHECARVIACTFSYVWQ